MATYGELMDQAMNELAAALATPTRFRGFREFRDRDLHHALLIVRARARLYRGLAGALRPFRHPVPPDALTPAAGWAVLQLHDEAVTSTAAVGAILSHPEPTDLPAVATINSAMALHLLRAADLAGAAWDLAATYITWRRRTPDMTIAAVYALLQQVQTDAADLAGALADLDLMLAETLHSWADVADLPPAAREAILTTLDDTARTRRGHLAHYATVFLANISRPSVRAHPIQTLRPIPMFSRQTITSPGTAAAAVALLRQWMHDDPGTLTTRDLANVAGACHRLALLGGQLAAQPARGPQRHKVRHSQHALDTAAAWRHLGMALRELTPLAAPSERAALSVTIASWATQYLRPDTSLPMIASGEPTRSRRRWITTLQEITAYLPDIAHLTGQHLATQLRRGNIVSPRGEDHHRAFSRPTPSQIEHLATILHTTMQRSAHLARLALELRPDTHPAPHIVDHAQHLLAATTTLTPPPGGSSGGTHPHPRSLRTELAQHRAERRSSRPGDGLEDRSRPAPTESAPEASPRHRP
jgi:hypothetical protein